jgi:hypothetical protein
MPDPWQSISDQRFRQKLPNRWLGKKLQMQGAQKNIIVGAVCEPPYRNAATTKLKRNAADGLFTQPSKG